MSLAMAYTPASDLEVVRRREQELAAARTGAEVDALQERWSAEDAAWREAADWRTRQVRELTQRVAALERLLGPGAKRLIDDLAAGVGAVLGKARAQDRERHPQRGREARLLRLPRRLVTGGNLPHRLSGDLQGCRVAALGDVPKGVRPGSDPAWQLAVKSGEAGKGTVVA